MTQNKWLSVEEAHIKTGQTCKLCNQQIMMERDESLPVGYFKQPPQSGDKSFSIAYRTKYSDHGLCLFHYKKKLGLFDSDAYYEEIKRQQCAKLKLIPLPVKRWR